MAEFASSASTPINFGPGDPQYAHRDDDAWTTSPRSSGRTTCCARSSRRPERKGRDDAPVAGDPATRSRTRSRSSTAQAAAFARRSRGDRLRGRATRATRRRRSSARPCGTRSRRRRRTRARPVCRSCARPSSDWVRRASAWPGSRHRSCPTLGTRSRSSRSRRRARSGSGQGPGRRDGARLHRSPSAARGSPAATCSGCRSPGADFLPDLDGVADATRGIAPRSCGSTTRTTRPAPSRRSRSSSDAAALARRHDFLLALDEAYSEVWFDAGAARVGGCSCPTARTSLVLNTLSKRSNDDGLPLRLRGRRPAADRGVEGAPALDRGDAAGVRPASLGRRLARRSTRARSSARATRSKRAHLPRALRGDTGSTSAGSVAGIYLWVARPRRTPVARVGAGAARRSASWSRPDRSSDRRARATSAWPWCRRSRTARPRGGRPRRSPRRSGGARVIAERHAELAARIEASYDAEDWQIDAEAVEEAVGLLDRGEVRVAEPTRRRRLGRERVGEEGRAALLPDPRHGDGRGGSVRVPRQAAAEARLRGCGRPRGAAGDRAVRRVPVARRRS